MSGPSPVVIEFLAKGVPEVLKAIRSISDAITKSERQSVAAAKKGASDRAKAAEKEAKDKVAAVTRGEAAANAARRAGTKDLEKKLREEVRLASKAAAEQVKLAKQIAAEEKKARLEILAGKQAGVARFGPQARLAELGAIRKLSLEEQRKKLAEIQGMRAADAVHKDLNRKQVDREKELERNKNAIRERSALMAGRFAAKQAEEERRKREQFGKTILGAGGRVVRNVTNIAGRVAQGVANVGGFSVEDSVQREVALRGQAATLAASSQGGFTGAQLLSSARAVATQQAMDPEAVLRAYDEIKKLSGENLGKGIQVMPDLAKIATASGADLGELGGLAGNILAADPKLEGKELLRQVRLFAQQGIAGGVEIGDFAKFGGRITAGAGLFGGNKEQNEAVLGGMAQIARQRGGAASAAEATLAAQRFGTDVQKHAADLEAKGIKVSDGKGTMRNAEDIAIDMLKKSGGDVTKLAHMGLGERGVRVLTGVADVYREAGGGDKGVEAVRKEFAKYKEVLSEAEVEERNKRRLAEVDAQLTTAFNDLRTAVGTELVPALTKLIPLIVQATPHVARLLQTLVDHPVTGLGAVLSASIAKEVASAGLKAILEKTLATSLGAAGGLSVASAVVAITAATMAVDKLSEDEQKRQNDSFAADAAAANAMPLLRPGGIKTKEDLEEAKKAASGLEASIAERQKGPSKLNMAMGFAGAAITDVATLGIAQALPKAVEAAIASKHEDQRAVDNQKETLAKFLKAIEEATKELNKPQFGPPSPSPSKPDAPNRTLPPFRR